MTKLLLLLFNYFYLYYRSKKNDIMYVVWKVVICVSVFLSWSRSLCWRTNNIDNTTCRPITISQYDLLLTPVYGTRTLPQCSLFLKVQGQDKMGAYTYTCMPSIKHEMLEWTQEDRQCHAVVAHLLVCKRKELEGNLPSNLSVCV